MADDSNIKNKTEELGTFNRIIKDTGEEITKLIPTLGSFFAVFKGAQIASSVKQMADFYQGFKNLSYQMGKSNTMSKDFLKNIYKIKIATGDTLNNLNEITVTLVKNRVEGGKTLQFLTKQISFFSEATGASVDTASQLAGELYRVGHLGPKSISSIMTSMLKVQRTVGLTSEEITNLSQNIITTTTELSNLNKSARFIEDFQKGTIKLASAFRTVGIEASRATEIVDRLLDINNLEDNMLLYAKMGVSIQDAVAGNLDPNMMTEGLRKVGAEIAGMSRPAGAALARQMGISYREALQYQNLKPTEDIATEDSDLEKMTREQRTLWTKIEKFFNSGIGWIASQFLQNPFAFGAIAFTAYMTFGKKVISWMKSRFNAIAMDFGDTLVRAFDQSYNKSQMKKDLKQNQGLASGKSGGNSLIDKLNASRDKAQRRGLTAMVGYEQALNAKTAFAANSNAALGAITNKRDELLAREQYLKAQGRGLLEQKWLARNIERLKDQEKKLAAGADPESRRLDRQYKKALNRLSPEQAGQIYVDAKAARENAFNQRKKLKIDKKNLEAMQSATEAALERAKTDVNYAHEIPSLLEAQEKIKKQLSDVGNSIAKTEQDWSGAAKKQKEMLGTGKVKIGTNTVAGKQHEFWWQSILPGLGNTFSGIGKVVGAGFGMLKKILLPMGLGMPVLMLIGKIMQRFQPLFEQLMPIVEGIFDTLATILTPVIKAVMKPLIWFMKGVYNAINWVAEWLGFGGGQKIDFDKILANIDSWNVGQKMDEQAEKNDENAVVMEMKNGRWVAQNPEMADKYWSGSGLGQDIVEIRQLLKNISDASIATVGAIENQTDVQTAAINTDTIKSLWGKYKDWRSNNQQIVKNGLGG